MAKPPKKLKPEEIETEPDGWDRFTKAVKRMAPIKPKRIRKQVSSRERARKKHS